MCISFLKPSKLYSKLYIAQCTFDLDDKFLLEILKIIIAIQRAYKNTIFTINFKKRFLGEDPRTLFSPEPWCIPQIVNGSKCWWWFVASDVVLLPLFTLLLATLQTIQSQTTFKIFLWNLTSLFNQYFFNKSV